MMLSIIALYNYKPDILDGIQPYIPTQPTSPETSAPFVPIDFEILKNTILLRAGELSLIYTDPDLFRLSFAVWAAKNRLEWQNLYDSLYYKYDPLFSKIREYALNRATTLNSDITENDVDTTADSTVRSETENTNRDIVTSDHTTENVTTNGREYGTADDRSSDTNTLYVQAYDDVGAGHWHEKEQTTNTGSKNSSSDYTNTGSDDTVTDSNKQTDDNIIKTLSDTITKSIRSELEKLYNRRDNGTLNDVITETVHGQRPYQELIQLQREIVQFNLYNFIANEFVRDFCVMIY